MKNNALKYMQENIGKELTTSPSPLSRWLKGVLLEAGEGSLVFNFFIREEMTNPMGILHGGMIAAIMDDMMGATVFCLGGEHFHTTVNLAIDYLSSARIGETVRAESKIIRQGKSIINAECILTNSQGKLLARGTSNLIITTIRTGN